MELQSFSVVRRIFLAHIQPSQHHVARTFRERFSNWDFTLARRVRLGSRANLRVQLQVYNLFNQVEFVALNADYLFSATGNASPDTGKYTHTTTPRIVGITMKLDF